MVTKYTLRKVIHHVNGITSRLIGGDARPQMRNLNQHISCLKVFILTLLPVLSYAPAAPLT